MGKMKALDIDFNHWFEVFYFKLLNDYHMTGEQAVSFFQEQLGEEAGRRANIILLSERSKELYISQGIKEITRNESPRQ